MDHIFICYSRKDQDQAIQLKKALEDQGKDIWLDQEDLPASSIWRDEIRNAITESVAFIFLLSSNSINSEYCQKEFKHARQLNKKIFPVLLPSLTDKDVSDDISVFQWLYWNDFGADLSNLRKLTNDIDTNYRWLKYHTELQVKATRWEENRDNSRLLRGKELREAEDEVTTAGKKNPQPTDSQRLYILESRKGEIRTRNSYLTFAVIVVLVLLFLSAFAFIQRNTAIENEKIALARQLAAQSSEMTVREPDKRELATLLAIQALRLSGGKDGDIALENNLSSYSKTLCQLTFPDSRQMPQGYAINSVIYDHQGKFVATAGNEGIVTIIDSNTCNKLDEFILSGTIEVIEFNPNDTKLAIVTNNNLYLWDIKTRSLTNKFTHDSYINKIVFSPNGKFVATASQDNTARLWNISLNQVEFIIKHDNNVADITFSPDGKLLATASWDKSVQIWTVEGIQKHKLEFKNEIDKVLFSPNGEKLAVLEESLAYMEAYLNNDPNWLNVAHEGDLTIWDLKSNRQVLKISSYVGFNDAGFDLSGFYDFIFANDGRSIITAGRDDNVRFWDTISGYEITSISHKGLPSLQETNNLLLTSNNDGLSGLAAATVWDIKTQRLLIKKYYSESKDGNLSTTIQFAIFNPNGKQFVVATEDKIFIENIFGGREYSTIRHKDDVSDIAFSPNNQLVATASSDGTTIVWNLVKNKEETRLGLDFPISNVSFSPNNHYLGLGGGEWVDYIKVKKQNPQFENQSYAIVWDLKNSREVMKLAHHDAVWGIDFSADGRFIATASADYTACVWDATSGEKLFCSDHPGYVYEVVFSPDSKLVAMASSEDAQVWDVETQQEIFMFHSDHVYKRISQVAFSQDSKRLATAGWDGTGRIWDIKTKKQLIEVHHEQILKDVVVSPDGKYLLTSGDDNTARVWDLSSGAEIAQMNHEGMVNSVDFSSEGNYILTATSDGLVRVWDINGIEVARFTHDAFLHDAKFSPNQNFIASASGDGTARIWKWQLEDRLTFACSTVTNNLTLSEWKYYIGEEANYDEICPKAQVPNDAKLKTYEDYAKWIGLICISCICIPTILVLFIAITKRRGTTN